MLGAVNNKSFCFISDDTEHDVPMVYMIQQVLTDYFNDKFPHIEKLIYFSDGCAGQYKNRKNFYNLCQHKMNSELMQNGTFLLLHTESHLAMASEERLKE